MRPWLVRTLSTLSTPIDMKPLEAGVWVSLYHKTTPSKWVFQSRANEGYPATMTCVGEYKCFWVTRDGQSPSGVNREQRRHRRKEAPPHFRRRQTFNAPVRMAAPDLSSLSMSGERVWLFATWLAAHVESFGAATSRCCIAVAADVEVETNGVIGGCSGALANQSTGDTRAVACLVLALTGTLALSKPPPALGISPSVSSLAPRSEATSSHG